MFKAFLLALLAASASPSPDHRYEGGWYVSDTTDNITGDREVYAFQSRIKQDDPDYVTLWMRCVGGKPTLDLEWMDVSFPDQTVLTIAPVAPNREPAETGYIFARSKDVGLSGVRASADVSRAIVAAVGTSNYITIASHLGAGSRTIGMETKGMQAAWLRVSRHCPVRKLPTPPL